MTYIDYGGFGQDYFEGSSVEDPHPAGYESYSDVHFDFGRLGDRVAGRAAEPVVILGAAYGYGVQELLDRDMEAAGMDISEWAVSQADSPVIQGDARVNDDVSRLTDEVQGRPSYGVTECLLACLTDDEAVTVCENLRSNTRNSVHVVWTDPNPEYYNKKTLTEWQELCDPDGQDEWIDWNDLQDYWVRE